MKISAVSQVVVACAAVGVWVPPCVAQELRCTQMFMNASEKRICATPSLMAQDAEMGPLARRAEMVDPAYDREQKAFRKRLKQCEGEEGCLSATYSDRVARLREVAASATALSETQEQELAGADAKASAKRDAQAETRSRIASELEAREPAANVKAEAEIDAVDLATDAAEVPVAGPSTEVEASAADEAIENLGQPLAAADTAPADTSATGVAKSGETSWTAYALFGFLALGAAGVAWEALTKACRRCDQCKRWFAGQVYNEDTQSYTDYETRTFTDVHRNRQGARTGSTEKKRQVAVRVTKTVEHLRCIHCGNPWRNHSTSRSS